MSSLDLQQDTAEVDQAEPRPTGLSAAEVALRLVADVIASKDLAKVCQDNGCQLEQVLRIARGISAQLGLLPFMNRHRTKLFKIVLRPRDHYRLKTRRLALAIIVNLVAECSIRQAARTHGIKPAALCKNVALVGDWWGMPRSTMGPAHRAALSAAARRRIDAKRAGGAPHPTDPLNSKAHFPNGPST